jgi:hypothetical protein
VKDGGNHKKARKKREKKGRKKGTVNDPNINSVCLLGALFYYYLRSVPPPLLPTLAYSK